MWQLLLLSHAQESQEIEALLDHEDLVSLSMLDAGEDLILEQALHEQPRWSKVKIEALFQQKDHALAALQRLEQANLGQDLVCQALPERNWVIYGLKDFLPLHIAQHLHIYPYWLLPEQPQQPFICLDPGFAFGTGEHPTTKMCLEWLCAHPPKDQLILDYGCGSGILGLAGLKLGARLAYGLDIDPQACEASRENAALNRYQQQFSIHQRQEELPQAFDLIIANIVMNPLLQLRDYFYQTLKPQGQLVLSGLLITQVEQVLRHYQSHFVLEAQQTEHDWACLSFVRQGVVT